LVTYFSTFDHPTIHFARKFCSILLGFVSIKPSFNTKILCFNPKKKDFNVILVVFHEEKRVLVGAKSRKKTKNKKNLLFAHQKSS
jgi:hypothetical protein